jgi:hypothetical protein
MINEIDWEPLLLVDRSDDLLQMNELKKKNKNYILTNGLGELI